MAGIVVIGSINYDYLLTQERLPRRGETFPASSMEGAFGGKGANQAVQAARLGGDVEFLGAVGPDDTGRRSRVNLHEHGIAATLDESVHGTGTAVVHITGAGEVYATIYAGANGSVDAAFVARHRSSIQAAGVVILQNEIPAEANELALTIATEAGVPVIYNAAPARTVDPSVAPQCSWFVVNEDEASFYMTRDLGDPGDIEAMKRAAQELRCYGNGVILTLGRHGSVIATDEASSFIPARPVNAVDTTGAGDSFVGAFAVALVNGQPVLAAASAAATVASHTVMGVGAQSSMPRREDLADETVFSASPHSRQDR